MLLFTFLLYLKQFLGWMGSLPLGAVSMSAYVVIGLTILSNPQAGSCWILTHCGSTKILCSWSIMNAVCKRGCKERLCLSPLLMFMLHCSIELHLQNTIPKIKLLGISREQPQNIKPNTGPFWLNKPPTLEVTLNGVPEDDCVDASKVDKIRYRLWGRF